MGDPVVLSILVAAGAVVVVTIVIRLLRARLEAREWAQRAAEVRRRRSHQHVERQELARRAANIVATSSTGQIAGYAIVRQIEAVFTDGHGGAAQAVEALKAQASDAGANALIHLATDRLNSGKYAARGDAVVVRPQAAIPATTPSEPP